MESDPQLDHRSDARIAGDQHPAGGRPVNPGNQFQERAFPGPIAPDETNRLAAPDAHRDAFQGPELLDGLPVLPVQQAERPHFQLDRRVVPEHKTLGDVLGFDHGCHSCSVNRSSKVRNSSAPTTNAPNAYAVVTSQTVACGQL